MASFQKRGKSWQYTISNKGKPIRKSGFRTKKEAQIAAAEMEDKLNKGQAILSKDVPFAEYFEEWISLYKTNIAKGTMRQYKYTLKAVQEYFGEKAIQKIRRTDYQAFINEFGKNKAKETVQKVNVHIRSCVLDALEDRVISVDFTRKVNLVWTNPAKKPREKHLNYEESQKLMKYLKSNLDKGLSYYLLLLGLVSGLRFSELVGLTRKDFDFEQNTINVDKTWGYTNDKKTGFGPTKNNPSIRVVTINPTTMYEFKKLFMKMHDNIHRLVFYSPASKYKVISNNAANKVLKTASEKLNIERITTHGLRHTHASILLYKKASMNYVSERLGHETVETTWKTYSHILDEMREEDEKLTISIFESM